MSFKQDLKALRRSARRYIVENTWALPAIGALVGILLALALRNVGSTHAAGSWGITVDRARDSLIAGVAVIFSGLSIVLALTAVTAQSVASRFSLRLLRIQQRGWRDKVVIAVFALTTMFIITTQLGLRSLQPDELAPAGGLLTSLALMTFTGATIIWYIGATMKSLRLDRTLQRISKLIRRTVHSVLREHHLDTPAPATALEPPPDATHIGAPRTGYLSNIDTKALHQIASQTGARLGFDVVIGTFRIEGQTIGWVVPGPSRAVPSSAAIAEAVDMEKARDPAYDIAYGIRILVDMAIMALSPAVNDPYTAVEVVNELTMVLVALAGHDPGPRGRQGPDGTFEVVIAGRSLSDYFDLATEQILLYGSTDPGVVAALADLAATVEPTADTEADRRHVQAFAARLTAGT